MEKFKRFLSTLLSIAMILTSLYVPAPVYAAEDESVMVTGGSEETVDMSSDEEVSQSDEVSNPEEATELPGVEENEEIDDSEFEAESDSQEMAVSSTEEDANVIVDLDNAEEEDGITEDEEEALGISYDLDDAYEKVIKKGNSAVFDADEDLEYLISQKGDSNQITQPLYLDYEDYDEATYKIGFYPSSSHPAIARYGESGYSYGGNKTNRQLEVNGNIDDSYFEFTVDDISTITVYANSANSTDKLQLYSVGQDENGTQVRTDAEGSEVEFRSTGAPLESFAEDETSVYYNKEAGYVYSQDINAEGGKYVFYVPVRKIGERNVDTTYRLATSDGSWNVNHIEISVTGNTKYAISSSESLYDDGEESADHYLEIGDESTDGEESLKYTLDNDGKYYATDKDSNKIQAFAQKDDVVTVTISDNGILSVYDAAGYEKYSVGYGITEIIPGVKYSFVMPAEPVMIKVLKSEELYDVIPNDDFWASVSKVILTTLSNGVTSSITAFPARPEALEDIKAGTVVTIVPRTTTGKRINMSIQKVLNADEEAEDVIKDIDYTRENGENVGEITDAKGVLIDPSHSVKFTMPANHVKVTAELIDTFWAIYAATSEDAANVYVSGNKVLVEKGGDNETAFSTAQIVRIYARDTKATTNADLVTSKITDIKYKKLGDDEASYVELGESAVKTDRDGKRYWEFSMPAYDIELSTTRKYGLYLVNDPDGLSVTANGSAISANEAAYFAKDENVEVKTSISASKSERVSGIKTTIDDLKTTIKYEEESVGSESVLKQCTVFGFNMVNQDLALDFDMIGVKTPVIKVAKGIGSVVLADPENGDPVIKVANLPDSVKNLKCPTLDGSDSVSINVLPGLYAENEYLAYTAENAVDKYVAYEGITGICVSEAGVEQNIPYDNGPSYSAEVSNLSCLRIEPLYTYWNVFTQINGEDYTNQPVLENSNSGNDAIKLTYKDNQVTSKFYTYGVANAPKTDIEARNKVVSGNVITKVSVKPVGGRVVKSITLKSISANSTGNEDKGITIPCTLTTDDRYEADITKFKADGYEVSSATILDINVEEAIFVDVAPNNYLNDKYQLNYKLDLGSNKYSDDYTTGLRGKVFSKGDKIVFWAVTGATTPALITDVTVDELDGHGTPLGTKRSVSLNTAAGYNKDTDTWTQAEWSFELDKNPVKITVTAVPLYSLTLEDDSDSVGDKEGSTVGYSIPVPAEIQPIDKKVENLASVNALSYGEAAPSYSVPAGVVMTVDMTKAAQDVTPVMEYGSPKKNVLAEPVEGVKAKYTVSMPNAAAMLHTRGTKLSVRDVPFGSEMVVPSGTNFTNRFTEGVFSNAVYEAYFAMGTPVKLYLTPSENAIIKEVKWFNDLDADIEDLGGDVYGFNMPACDTTTISVNVVTQRSYAIELKYADNLHNETLGSAGVKLYKADYDAYSHSYIQGKEIVPGTDRIVNTDAFIVMAEPGYRMVAVSADALGTSINEINNVVVKKKGGVVLSNVKVFGYVESDNSEANDTLIKGDVTVNVDRRSLYQVTADVSDDTKKIFDGVDFLTEVSNASSVQADTLSENAVKIDDSILSVSGDEITVRLDTAVKDGTDDDSVGRSEIDWSTFKAELSGVYTNEGEEGTDKNDDNSLVLIKDGEPVEITGGKIVADANLDTSDAGSAALKFTLPEGAEPWNEMKVTVSFEKKKYTVSGNVVSASEASKEKMGTLTVSSNATGTFAVSYNTATYGDDVYVKAVAEPGYELAADTVSDLVKAIIVKDSDGNDVAVKGLAYQGNEFPKVEEGKGAEYRFTFKAPAKNITVSGEFRTAKYALSIEEDGVTVSKADGSTWGDDKTVRLDYKAPVQVMITANDDYSRDKAGVTVTVLKVSDNGIQFVPDTTFGTNKDGKLNLTEVTGEDGAFLTEMINMPKYDIILKAVAEPVVYNVDLASATTGLLATGGKLESVTIENKSNVSGNGARGVNKVTVSSGNVDEFTAGTRFLGAFANDEIVVTQKLKSGYKTDAVTVKTLANASLTASESGIFKMPSRAGLPVVYKTGYRGVMVFIKVTEKEYGVYSDLTDCSLTVDAAADDYTSAAAAEDTDSDSSDHKTGANDIVSSPQLEGMAKFGKQLIFTLTPDENCQFDLPNNHISVSVNTASANSVPVWEAVETNWTKKGDGTYILEYTMTDKDVLISAKAGSYVVTSGRGTADDGHVVKVEVSVGGAEAVAIYDKAAAVSINAIPALIGKELVIVPQLDPGYEVDEITAHKFAYVDGTVSENAADTISVEKMKTSPVSDMPVYTTKMPEKGTTVSYDGIMINVTTKAKKNLLYFNGKYTEGTARVSVSVCEVSKTDSADEVYVPQKVASGRTSIATDTKVMVTITPEIDYNLDITQSGEGWSAKCVELTGIEEYKMIPDDGAAVYYFDMPADGAVITIDPKDTLYTYVSDLDMSSYATITTDPEEGVRAGDIIKITVSANKGYSITSTVLTPVVSGNQIGSIPEVDTHYADSASEVQIRELTFTMPSGGVKLNVAKNERTYRVNSDGKNDEGVKVTNILIKDDKDEVASSVAKTNHPVDFRVEPIVDYVLKSLIVEGADGEVYYVREENASDDEYKDRNFGILTENEDGVYTFNMPASDVTIKAVSIKKGYTVSVNAAGEKADKATTSTNEAMKANKNYRITTDEDGVVSVVGVNTGDELSFIVELTQGYEIDWTKAKAEITGGLKFEDITVSDVTLLNDKYIQTISFTVPSEPTNERLGLTYQVKGTPYDITFDGEYEGKLESLSVKTGDKDKTITNGRVQMDADDAVKVTIASTIDYFFGEESISINGIALKDVTVTKQDKEVTYSFKMPAGDVSFTINPEAVLYPVNVMDSAETAKYVDVTVDDENGTEVGLPVVITLEYKDGYSKGSVEFTDKDGNVLKAGSMSSNKLPDGSVVKESLVVTMVSGGINLNAGKNCRSYSVTTKATGATVTTTAVNSKAAMEEKVSITVAADDDFSISSVRVVSASGASKVYYADTVAEGSETALLIRDAAADSTWSYTQMADDVVIIVETVPIPYTAKVKAAENAQLTFTAVGDITATGNGTGEVTVSNVNAGDVLNFTISCGKGYAVDPDSITASVAGTENTLTVNANGTFNLAFAIPSKPTDGQITFTVGALPLEYAILSKESMAVITDLNLNAPYGAVEEFTVIPVEGYKLVAGSVKILDLAGNDISERVNLSGDMGTVFTEGHFSYVVPNEPVKVSAEAVRKDAYKLSYVFDEETTSISVCPATALEYDIVTFEPETIKGYDIKAITAADKDGNEVKVVSGNSIRMPSADVTVTFTAGRKANGETTEEEDFNSAVSENYAKMITAMGNTEYEGDIPVIASVEDNAMVIQHYKKGKVKSVSISENKSGNSYVTINTKVKVTGLDRSRYTVVSAYNGTVWSGISNIKMPRISKKGNMKLKKISNVPVYTVCIKSPTGYIYIKVVDVKFDPRIRKATVNTSSVSANASEAIVLDITDSVYKSANTLNGVWILGKKKYVMQAGVRQTIQISKKISVYATVTTKGTVIIEPVGSVKGKVPVKYSLNGKVYNTKVDLSNVGVEPANVAIRDMFLKGFEANRNQIVTVAK